MTSIEASAYIDKLGHEAQDAELQTLYRKIAEIYKRKYFTFPLAYCLLVCPSSRSLLPVFVCLTSVL